MNILVVAGETSGDTHGAELVRALAAARSGLSFAGFGGRRMREAGVEILEDPTAFASVGPLEAFARFRDYWRLFHRAKSALRTAKPDAVILIDFPDFNLRLAPHVKKAGLPLIYYISPQVWAWRQGRVKDISRLVDLMVVIFPFEKNFYESHHVPVEWVGHPLVDVLDRQAPDRTAARAALGFGPDETVVGLLPGSRESEFSRIFPSMRDAAHRLKAARPALRFALALGPDISAETEAEARRAGEPIGLSVFRGAAYPVLRAADAAWVASGTATLEAAILGTPMVVVYRVNPLTWAVARALVSVDHVGMVNLVAGRRIMPELLQGDANPENLARAMEALLDPESNRSARASLTALRGRLGEPGAAGRAAKVILNRLHGPIST